MSSGRARRASDRGLLPMTLESYLTLLDWTGRQWHSRTRPVLDCLRALPPDCGNSPGTRFDRGHVRILTRAFSTEQSERLPAWRKEPRGLAQLRAFISWALGLVSSARCQYLDKRCASIIGPRAPIAWLNGYNHAVVSVLFKWVALFRY